MRFLLLGDKGAERPHLRDTDGTVYDFGELIVVAFAQRERRDEKNMVFGAFSG